MRSPIVLVLIGLALASCDDSTGPATGDATLHILVTTTGGDIDLDGYELRIDDKPGTPVDATDDLTYAVRAGQHDLAFVGLAPNCTLTGDPRRRFTASIGETVQVRFEILCRPTGVGITVNTTGPDPDPNGYQILVDGALKATVTASGMKVVSRLEPGEHTVMLGGITPNCSLDGPPTRTLTVTNATITAAAFNLSCTATYGAVRIAVTTTGERPDNDYVVLLGTDPEFEPLGPEGHLSGTSAFIVSPVIGAYFVRLTEVAANCTVAGGPDRTVNVSVGGVVRDTALASFAVSCVRGDATVRITTTTTGSEASATYTVDMFLDDCIPYYCTPEQKVSMSVAANGVASALVMSGTYALYFRSGSNCRYETAFQQSVDAPPGATVDLEFALFCERPVLRVAAPTTGSNPDAQYVVLFWTSDWIYGTYGMPLGTLTAGGTIEARVSPSYYASWVQLGGVAANCSVGVPNPTTSFTLDWGDVRDVVFPVTCGP